MKFRKKTLYRAIVLAVFSFILLWSAYFFCSNFAVKPVYDFLIKVTSPARQLNDIVVVTIDDQSINKIGRWPWKRIYYADIFEYMENVAGAKAVAFDSVIVSYGNKQDDEEFFKRFAKLNKVIPGVFFSAQDSFFHNENEENLDKIFRDKFSINVNDLRKEKPEYASCSYSLEEIMAGAKSMGSVLSHPDEDGIIRKAEPVFYYKGNYYPSLALAVFKHLYPDAKFELSKNFFKVNDTNIPLESGRFGYIKWYKGYESNPYKTISAWKIIKREDIDPSDFKDKIVVVGTTSTALKDIKSTPMNMDYPGVYIQATLIDNLLHGKFMVKPSKLQENLLLFVTVVLGFSAVLLLPPLYSSVLLGLLSVGYFYVCLFFAYPNNIALDAITPIIFIICIMLVGYGYEYFIEDDKKRRTRNLIAKYVSKDIMETILDDIEGTKLGGKRADISVLFVDIRNFTHISETLPPEKVSELLNEYFSHMIPIIFKYKGTVNKFIGDALLVIFGAPVENPEHPILAIKCALEMLDKVQEFSNINIGIGINTGEAFVG
ncbi:MAG: hypothetical protein A2Y25_05880, partial [Candidatus Melainabacteria bacterium GWF2_37_15]